MRNEIKMASILEITIDPYSRNLIMTNDSEYGIEILCVPVLPKRKAISVCIIPAGYRIIYGGQANFDLSKIYFRFIKG